MKLMIRLPDTSKQLITGLCGEFRPFTYDNRAGLPNSVQTTAEQLCDSNLLHRTPGDSQTLGLQARLSFAHVELFLKARGHEKRFGH